jgi:hypothetical protein
MQDTSGMQPSTPSAGGWACFGNVCVPMCPRPQKGGTDVIFRHPLALGMHDLKLVLGCL